MADSSSASSLHLVKLRRDDDTASNSVYFSCILCDGLFDRPTEEFSSCGCCGTKCDAWLSVEVFLRSFNFISLFT